MKSVLFNVFKFMTFLIQDSSIYVMGFPKPFFPFLRAEFL
jgi:hypothetical protein